TYLRHLHPFPTRRSSDLLAIAGGAHGIGYFPKDWSPDIGAEIAREKREIETLGPALTAPAIPAGAEGDAVRVGARDLKGAVYVRSEEHTSELQSPYDLVC